MPEGLKNDAFHHQNLTLLGKTYRGCQMNSTRLREQVTRPPTRCWLHAHRDLTSPSSSRSSGMLLESCLQPLIRSQPLRQALQQEFPAKELCPAIHSRCLLAQHGHLWEHASSSSPFCRLMAKTSGNVQVRSGAQPARPPAVYAPVLVQASQDAPWSVRTPVAMPGPPWQHELLQSGWRGASTKLRTPPPRPWRSRHTGGQPPVCR